MRVGYARVSIGEQKLDLQVDALRAAGCDRLCTDMAGGARAERPGLVQALAACQPGDTLVVWKLDRLGRSLPHLVQTVHDLDARGVGFRSLRESIDTTSPGGGWSSISSPRSRSSSGTSSASVPTRGSRRRGPGAAKAGARRA